MTEEELAYRAYLSLLLTTTEIDVLDLLKEARYTETGVIMMKLASVVYKDPSSWYKQRVPVLTALLRLEELGLAQRPKKGSMIWRRVRREG